MSQLLVKSIEDKSIWEEFILSQPSANFLQSWNWGVFHQQLGQTVFRLGLFDSTTQIGAAECVVEDAKRGRYMTIAGGPILSGTSSFELSTQVLTQFRVLLDEVTRLAHQQQCLFIRVRPQLIDEPEVRALFSQLKFVESPMHLTADLTLQLDLTQTPDELLKQMRKNTRYEVRRADKLRITTTSSSDLVQIKEFYDHQLWLAQKHGFVPFSYEFLYEQFKAFVKDDQVLLIHAWQDQRLLASAFVIFYNREAVYHYGISTPENQKLPGSYACQWAAIQEAQRRGCTRYNFWGIAPQDQPDHRFAGVSLFKRGWGGTEVEYLPAHDLPLSWKYQLIKSFELVRKKSRKL